MVRRALLLVLLTASLGAASLGSGCVTLRLWELRPTLVGPAPAPPAPLAIERAVRDGRGAVHLLIDCGAGRRHHLVIQRARPHGPGAAWPHAGRGEATVSLADPAPLPEGAPLATWSDDGEPAPPAGAALEPGRPTARVELLGDAFELVHADGRRELLAYVPPRRRPWPAAEGVTGRDVAGVLLCAASTPLTLAADLAVLVLAPLWYPFHLLRP
ncbi:MAG: hypothetical protein M9894_03240 [Planctomycetes bacterium]|nr:hypothetical protein [Planctomycetota bacterium]